MFTKTLLIWWNTIYPEAITLRKMSSPQQFLLVYVALGQKSLETPDIQYDCQSTPVSTLAMGLIKSNTHYFDWCGTGIELNTTYIINAGMNIADRSVVNL